MPTVNRDKVTARQLKALTSSASTKVTNTMVWARSRTVAAVAFAVWIIQIVIGKQRDDEQRFIAGDHAPSEY